MAYPTLAPTLSALSSVLATPADTELANAWPAVDRQTRNWLYDFLTTYFDPTTNQLKPAAIGGGTVPTGSVSGTNPQTGSQGQIVQGSIQSQDIANFAITGSILANACVASANIANSAVQTQHIQDGAVTQEKLAAGVIDAETLAPGSITAALLGSGCVTSVALAAQCVANANIAPRAVDGSMLPTCNAGQILVGGNSVGNTPNCAVAMTLSGAITIAADGTTQLNSTLASTILSFARVSEMAPSGVSCGPSNDTHAYAGGNTGTQGYAATYTPWQGRGLGQSNNGSYGSVSWTEILDPANLLTVSDTILTTPIIVGNTTYNTFQKPIYVNQQCVLLVMVSIPGYDCGSHKLRLTTMADPTQPQNLQQYWGTSEVATGTITTRSVLSALISFAAPAGSALPYFYIDWFAQNANANGMGLAGGLGGNEYYGDISVLRLA